LDRLTGDRSRAALATDLFAGLHQVVLESVLSSGRPINQDTLPRIASELHGIYKRAIDDLIAHAFTDDALGFVVSDEEPNTDPSVTTAVTNADGPGDAEEVPGPDEFAPLPAAETRWYFVTTGSKIGVFQGP
jgi:hypothetical protein